jgi:hypothetical protein
MKIAILGWGSLVWDPRALPLAGPWLQGGPYLPIEFTRISTDGRLTLVIDYINGAGITVRFATSARRELDDAVEDLRQREGPTRRENIGSVTAQSDPTTVAHDRAGQIAAWCRAAGFDAAVWTALGSNFREKRGTPFTVGAAMKYLAQLGGEQRRLAFEYVNRAPAEVDTPLRRAFAAARL